CYIAPEQLRGKPTRQSDIYSFGCLLFFLLEGEDPRALKQCDLDSRGQVSQEIVQLVKRCTEFDEQLRFDSFQEIVAVLSGDVTS
ncbi:MAG: hypothetical protein K2Z81_18160, partial [Cyanobacteria bacterium]|nr:hypothetical protein [Cyanobacteriota bacterium]